MAGDGDRASSGRSARVIADAECPGCDDSTVLEAPGAGSAMCADCGERGHRRGETVEWWRHDPDSMWYVEDDDTLRADGGQPAGGNDHTGPIIFADETARSQLLDEGEVVTFRTSRRTTGKTWWRKSRTGQKCGDVVVEEIGECDPRDLDQLEPYGPLSGFQSAREWQFAIDALNDGIETGYLYRVRSQSTASEGQE